MSLMNENGRMDALQQLDLLDTPPSESFDRITRMASGVFGLPMAVISLTDVDRQWFLSRTGMQQVSMPRDKAPCARVAETSAILVIEDLLDDPAFADGPLAREGVRFYAGAPLLTGAGYCIGALCVIGTEPRSTTDAEIAMLVDLSRIVMAEIELKHACGRIDPVSGLPNRTQFLTDMTDLGRACPDVRRTAVLVDLALSTEINNGIRVMGAGYIDTFIQGAAHHMRKALGRSAKGYHVAATQFAFLAPEGVDETEYAARLTKELRHMTECTFGSFMTTPTAGLAPFLPGLVAADEVLTAAHCALMHARESNVSVACYVPASQERHRRNFTLLNDFSGAIGTQLRLVFQPKVDLQTGLCSGAEALLRWRHPILGEISPGEFVPVVENTLLAQAMTEWVVEAVAAQIAEWSGRGIIVPVSLNMSAANLMETGFAQEVRATLSRHGVPPEMVEIEITESTVMADAEQSMQQMLALAEIGVRLAIDDFGTGYSSLAYLQNLPAKVVKIDRSFVMDIEKKDRKARNLVMAMAKLAKDLGYRVVAEGVETAEAAAIVRDMGCDEGQGYHFARPLERGDFERWLAADAERAAEGSVAA